MTPEQITLLITAGSALGGALVGFGSSILVAWINKRHEDRKQIRELAVKVGIENWKELIQVARGNVGGGKMPPLDVFVVQAVKLVEIFVAKGFRKRRLEAKLAELRSIIREMYDWLEKEDLGRQQGGQ